MSTQQSSMIRCAKLAIVIYVWVFCLGGCARGDQMDRVLDAIRMVESGGDANAVGDGGRAIGPLQMWKVRVDDCNRIVGRKRWTYEDRWSMQKSAEMFRTSCLHYWPKGGPEQWCRHWNGSPTKGPYDPKTLPYWKRCQKILSR